jgi:hypothetical protein
MVVANLEKKLDADAVELLMLASRCPAVDNADCVAEFFFQR